MSRLRIAMIGVVLTSLFGMPYAHADLADVDCSKGPDKPCFIESTGLALRVLPKPQSNIYVQANEGSAQVKSNVPALEPYYVFSMEDVTYDENFVASGWFNVGASLTGPPEGFMKADDVIPWKQALAVAFTDPGPSERKPVLLFGDQNSLDATMSGIEDGSADANKLYEDLNNKKVVDGIVSREGNAYVNIDKTFYLMPILNFIDLSTFDADNRPLGLQIAALTTQARSDQSNACDLRQSNATDCLDTQSARVDSDLGMNAVFVIDMSQSMQPQIDAVQKAVYGASQLLASNFKDSSAQLKLGLVGYRDDPEASPGLEWAAKNFTPSLLDAKQFSDLLSSGAVRAATVGSGDTPEDLFAGMKAAIESSWSEDVPRMIILIGDASGHPTGDPKNSTDLNEKVIREMADQKRIKIASILVGSDSNNDLAIPQFQAMAIGKESDAAFAHVTGTANSEGSTLEASLRDAIENLVNAVSKNSMESVMSDNTDASDTAGLAVMSAVRAAFVDYLGKEATPPTNIVAWALDRDITDVTKKSFDIKVMMSRQDIEELMALLKGLLEQLQGGKQTSTFAFGQVQSSSSAATFDLGIDNTDAINKSASVPRWVTTLPYKSEVLSMTLGEFTDASPDDRTRFETRLNSLVKLYDEVLNTPDSWVQLNEDGPAEDKVHMLDLSDLP